MTSEDINIINGSIIDMTNVVTIYVKEVFTCNTKNYVISNSSTIYNLIEKLTPFIHDDFNMIDYDLVDINQTNENGNGNLAENGYPMIGSSDTIKNKYHNSNYIALYVRRRSDENVRINN